MAFTTGKFIEPNGAPSNGVQAMQSSTVGPADVADNKKAAARASGTGVILSNGITANANTTLFDLGRVVGQIVDNTTDPENPTVTMIDRPASTGHLSPLLGTENVTHIAIDSSGNIAYFANTLTNAQHRDYLYLGLIAHLDQATITVINNEPTVCWDTSVATQDLLRNMEPLNVKDGNVYSGNTSALTLARTEGYLNAVGINYTVNKKQPDLRTIAAEATVTNIVKVFSDNTNELFTGTNNEILNPDVWEDIAGVGAGLSNEQTVPSNKWTNQLIVMFREGRTNIQVGQKLYSSKDEALADIGRSGYIVAPVIEDLAIALCVLTIKVGTTDFSDPANFQFTNAETPHGIKL